MKKIKKLTKREQEKKDIIALYMEVCKLNTELLSITTRMNNALVRAGHLAM